MKWDFLREDDLSLVGRIIGDRDMQAADELIGRHYKMVYKIVYVKVSDEELAMDITQEVFIAMLKGLNSFDSKKSSFKTWISRIANNKVIDFYRSRQNQERMVTDILEDYDREDEFDVEREVLGRVSVENVDFMLSDERQDVRRIFNMKVQEGYTFEEIGHAMGMSSSAVKSKYYGIVKKLRREMSANE